ncbi:hypothetical protein SAMN02745216_05295 [Desulfatibacillum alkenivorans DSM 16219]|uniref:Uncharacterized protein n=1 Tax=Desulfatibacillum alkenivorans DSM 16219 TaxID=1121393 RepID=A0A1M7BBC4_9BACT|nr:hypothetical protein [Desulfatibacillum alkenivorans]SHL52325.1 hypothetical protein SAMN02745216_05295 [Desulfatibacillum alkenivorans DSM 16219]
MSFEGRGVGNGVRLLAVAAAFIFCILTASGYAGDMEASLVEDFGDVTVMSLDGDDVVQELEDNASDSRRTIANAFYETHGDDYDFLVMFTDFEFDMPRYTIGGEPAQAAGYYSSIKNDTDGLGQAPFDLSDDYGSAGRLQGFITMGHLYNLETDPMEPDFSKLMRTMSHELLHRFAADARFVDATGAESEALLWNYDPGAENRRHWSYLLDTDGSLLYGNDWQDNGDGTFTSLPGRKYYSPLDLYLMGLVDKSEVPPMLLIDNPDINPEKLPQTGVTISGDALTVTIEDIIAAVGERIPSAANAPKEFKVGFILLTKPGEFLEKDYLVLSRIIPQWKMWFSALTDGRGPWGRL